MPRLGHIDGGRSAHPHGEFRQRSIEHRLDLLALGVVGIPSGLLAQRSVLAEAGVCDLAASVLDGFSPGLLNLEACVRHRVAQRSLYLRLFCRGEVFRIDLFPCAVVLEELGAAGWKQRQVLEPRVLRQMRQHLLFELRPIAA